ncbi:MAG: TetR/AcrR family transcriptional regulator [Deltaproteobacteria bacterium]|nr:TetR/AcrR family transcriptional regulator [Deltaproteobacteria bacterium]
MTAEELHTRDKLIAATRALLIENGHAACTVKAIAVRAGVNHGLVHHYFGSKEGLLVAVLEHTAQEMLHHVPPGDRLQSDFKKFVRTVFLSNPERTSLMAEFFAMARHVPGVAAKLGEILPLRRQMMMKLTGVDNVTVALFQGALVGLAIQNMVDPTIPTDAAAERLALLVLEDSGTPPPAPKKDSPNTKSRVSAHE